MIMSEKAILSYAKLWKLMIDKNINKTQLKEMAHISTNAVAKMSKNEPVSLITLSKVCYVMDCGIGDIIEISFEGFINSGGKSNESKEIL